MPIANIHCHMLYGIDDGAKTPEMSVSMIDKSYKDGVRVLCMTPHYNPAYFKYHSGAMVSHYKKLKAYAAEKYPDLKICLGQEIFYYHDTVEDIMHGRCLTLNKTRCVLVEFSPMESRTTITANVSNLLTSGFTPVVAHIERYDSIRKKKGVVEELKRRGAYIQVNAASILGKYGFGIKRYVMSLIKHGLADIVADDCHNMTDKAPSLGEAYDAVKRKFGVDTANRVFFTTTEKLLFGR